MGKKHISISPYDAMEKGIGMVHQEFMLLPGFTITENIKLNREITNPNPVSRLLGKNLESLDMKAMAFDARKALDDVGMNLDEKRWSMECRLDICSLSRSQERSIKQV